MKPAALVSRLTPRELESLQCLAEGLTYKEIAGRMAITESTVKRHVEHLYRKLKVRSRTAAVVLYLNKRPRGRLNSV